MNPKKFYKVDEATLKNLIHNDLMLSSLEYGGVDNWIGYDDAQEMYEEEYGPLNDLVKENMSNFEEIQ